MSRTYIKTFVGVPIETSPILVTRNEGNVGNSLSVRTSASLSRKAIRMKEK